VSKWAYGAGLINIGIYEVIETFTDNSTETNLLSNNASNYMDVYYQSGKEAYNVTNNITMPFDSSPGDHLGLYPVSYLMRYQYASKKNSSDLYVSNQVGIKYILGYPTRLPDGTISRNSGWDSEPGHNSFLWADDMFMGLTLLSRLAIENLNDEYMDWVASQKLGFAKRMQDKDGVFFHGYNENDTKTSCCKWGRANGWIMMSHVEELLAFEKFPGHPLQPLVLDIFVAHCDGLRLLQDSSGLWRQVLNETSLWLETSGTAMFLYAYSVAIVHNWIPDDVYGPVCDKAWKGLTTVVMDDGTVNGICEGCGIQVDVAGYANKSTAYTSSQPGLGSVLRAAAAYQKLLVFREKNNNNRVSN